MHHILVDKYLPSGCGFHVFRTDDIRNRGKGANINYMAAKTWSRAHCDIWAYTPAPHIRLLHKDETIYDEVHSHYFAFNDEMDLLAISLFMNTQTISTKAMWPSHSKFIIFVDDGIECSNVMETT